METPMSAGWKRWIVAVRRAPSTTTWTSADGKFSTDAEFIYMGGGAVKLRKKDGNEISVPLDRLSDSDQKWIRDYRRGK